MKPLFLLALCVPILASCDVKVDNSDPPKGKDTTIIAPGEKKTENNTTIVTPEKKTETNTTIVTPAPKVEKKETTIINPKP